VPTRFAAITIRISNPKCTALLFTSGKLVITGVRSWYECLLASLCISRSVRVSAEYWLCDNPKAD
jgi:transcription initiation factor TFIID TATA-box-binding protein